MNYRNLGLLAIIGIAVLTARVGRNNHRALRRM